MGERTSGRIVVTGLTGTLGRGLVEALGRRPGTRVLALVRSTGASSLPAWVEPVEVDLFDTQRVGEVVRAFAPTGFVHCAATGMEFPRARWFDLIRFNVDVSINLCEAAAGVPGCHFVFVSTGLAYRDQGRPLTEADPLDTLHPYGASKAAADQLVRAAAAEFDVPLTVVRPFSFTGPGDDRTRLFGSLLRAAVEGQPFALTAGTQVRDHCSSLDVAEGIALALEAPPQRPGEPHVYNLGSGDRAPLKALVERVVAELAVPVRLEFGAAPPRRFDPAFLVADTARARAELGWRPRHSLAHAVWSLARESFPSLNLVEPRKELG